MRIAFYLYTLLAAAGVFVSERLIRIHLDTLYAKAGDTGICGGEGFSCAEAAASGYAEIFGLPIAALGMAFYVSVLVLVGVARFKESTRDRLADIFLLGGLASVAYSVFLAIVSAVDIGKLCPFCMALYGVNLGLLLTAGFGHPEGWRGLRRIGGALFTREMGLTVAVLAVATVAAQGWYAHRAGDAAERARPHQPHADLSKPAQLEVEIGDAPGQGPADAPLVVVEFSDFQCPHCRRLADSLKAVSAEMPGKVRYHFKHFPMDPACNRIVDGPGHAQACGAAVAMVCAERMGKGWAMHDLIFENQRNLPRDALVGFARRIGVDVEAFDACLDDPKALERVKADIEQGIALGVPGTPVWFVNGWRQVGAREPAVLQAILEQRLRADGGAR